ncbi:MAG: gliding motility-associated C-terminal domain-containing protein [Bacteroidia bacterium]|nr:gliding motility-associated C-terminal domain-containing protein [Bacteroidia bacterium]
MILRLTIFFVGVCAIASLSAQTDTEFWFAAPEVAIAHGDRPIQLRVSAFDSSATVTVSRPANPTATPIHVTVNSNETRTIDLSGYIQYIENTSANTNNPNGLLIQSTAPIAAYYEVANPFNPEVFVLKGKNALGTRFYVPTQTTFPNMHGSDSFEIVATRDQTTITITPAQAIVGHAANTTFTIVLNRGETYSARATGTSGYSHLAGSKIVSDKPIAVTSADDSIVIGFGWDLIGDQLVPESVIGKEYIVVKGSATQEKVYITATRDNTEIFFSGNSFPQHTLDAGESVSSDILGAAMHIRASAPIYVLHLSGVRDEAGSALLPSIGCTGAKGVGFARGSGDVYLIILTEKGNEGSFTLNGSAAPIPASAFTTVPGTSSQWVSARILVTSFLNTGGNNRIRNNDGFFHLGVFYDTNIGAAYGYFSEYNSLYLGESQKLCAGDTLLLDAGNDKDSYLWQDGSTESTLRVTTGGTYWVRSTFEGCELVDTVEIELIDPQVNLGPDREICPDDTVALDASYPGASYLWNYGAKDSTVFVRTPGLYAVTVSKDGCEQQDSVLISLKNLPEVELGPDTILCDNEPYLLDVSAPGASYRWQDGSTLGTFQINATGKYWVDVMASGCVLSDTIYSQSIFAEADLGPDTVLCPDEVLIMDISHPDALAYIWQDGSTSPQREIREAGSYWVELTNYCQTLRDSLTVGYKECDCTLFVPTAFTPNHDGVNDYFYPVFQCEMTGYQLQVFNRWGNIVFETDNPDVHWDGYSKGSASPSGVYAWRLVYQGLLNRRPVDRLLSGTVTIVR